jgi:hypothetical protein
MSSTMTPEGLRRGLGVNDRIDHAHEGRNVAAKSQEVNPLLKAGRGNLSTELLTVGTLSEESLSNDDNVNVGLVSNRVADDMPALSGCDTAEDAD